MNCSWNRSSIADSIWPWKTDRAAVRILIHEQLVAGNDLAAVRAPANRARMDIDLSPTTSLPAPVAPARYARGERQEQVNSTYKWTGGRNGPHHSNAGSRPRQ